jgi:palmitoyl-protein thioesterase
MENLKTNLLIPNSYLKVKIRFYFDMYVSTVLVDMYSKFRNLGLARKVLNDMTDRSLMSLITLIGRHERHEDMGNALSLFQLISIRDSAVFNIFIDQYVSIYNNFV